MITKEKMQDYEDIRKSGQTNMYVIKNVIALSGEEMTKEDCLDIMENYDKYMEKFNIERS